MASGCAGVVMAFKLCFAEAMPFRPRSLGAMVRWSDGLYGGLIAGLVSALFFLFCGVAILHEPVLGDYFVRFSVGVFGSRIEALPPESVDAILHDPPRFGIAGELYSGAFYNQLARVLKRGGRLFHYTGAPNKLTSGRDVAMEVSARLSQAGFATELNGDGVLAVLKSPRRP